MAKRKDRNKPAPLQKVVVTKSRLRLWPFIYCPTCDKVLAFVREPAVKRIRGSFETFRQNNAVKIDIKAFYSHKTVKLKGYEIDFHKYDSHKTVLCPACKTQTVFNLFPSGPKPTFNSFDKMKQEDDIKNNS